MVPLFTGIFVSWFDLMEMFNLDSSWFWSNIVGRLLLGTVPGMDLLYRDGFGQGTGEHGMQEIIASLSPAGQLASLAAPQIWIGAVVGALMIFGAIQLRRRRELAERATAPPGGGPAAGRRILTKPPSKLPCANNPRSPAPCSC